MKPNKIFLLILALFIMSSLFSCQKANPSPTPPDEEESPLINTPNAPDNKNDEPTDPYVNIAKYSLPDVLFSPDILYQDTEETLKINDTYECLLQKNYVFVVENGATQKISDSLSNLIIEHAEKLLNSNPYISENNLPLTCYASASDCANNIIPIYCSISSFSAEQYFYKSFVINYNLATGKEIKLGDLFSEGLDYCGFINKIIAEENLKNYDIDGYYTPFTPVDETTPFTIRLSSDIQFTTIAFDGTEVYYFVPIYKLEPYIISEAFLTPDDKNNSNLFLRYKRLDTVVMGYNHDPKYETYRITTVNIKNAPKPVQDKLQEIANNAISNTEDDYFFYMNVSCFGNILVCNYSDSLSGQHLIHLNIETGAEITQEQMFKEGFDYKGFFKAYLFLNDLTDFTLELQSSGFYVSASDESMFTFVDFKSIGYENISFFNAYVSTN